MLPRMTNLPPPSLPPPAPEPPIPSEPANGTPKSRKRTALFVGLGVLVVVALGVVGFLVFGGDDDSSLDTTKALSNVTDIIDATDVSDGDSAAIVDCPMGDLDTLAKSAPEGLDAVAAARGEENYEVFTFADDPSFVQCTATPDSGSSVGVLAGAAPDGDFEKYIESSLAEFDVTFSSTGTANGGSIVSYCAELADGGSPFCEADWSDGTMQIGVLSTDAGASTDELIVWLKAVLPGIVQSLVDANPDEFPTTGS